eukprot:1157754-Pelagomonas_calceolata.AAC.8
MRVGVDRTKYQVSCARTGQLFKAPGVLCVRKWTTESDGCYARALVDCTEYEEQAFAYGLCCPCKAKASQTLTEASLHAGLIGRSRTPAPNCLLAMLALADPNPAAPANRPLSDNDDCGGEARHHLQVGLCSRRAIVIRGASSGKIVGHHSAILLTCKNSVEGCRMSAGRPKNKNSRGCGKVRQN